MRHIFFNPHFMDEITDTEKLDNLSKGTQLLSDRARILVKKEWPQGQWKYIGNSRP